MNTPKYMYHVKTWGGFYNDEHKEKHGLLEGDFLFDTSKERDKFIKSLGVVEKNLSANYLGMTLTEGFDCETRTVLHRIIQFQGNNYYSKTDLGINYGLESAKFIMENKWFPGHNDYPLGVDFDYDTCETISEWITGAFNIKDTDY